MNSPSHSSQHANANDALEAIEAKVGIDGSAVTTSHSYKLSSVTSTAKAVPDTRTITAGSGITGGGDLSANRTVAVDISGLTADASPDVSADYLMTYDASATGLKKVLLSVLESALSLANLIGTLAVGKGGTGQTTYTNGQLLIGNTTGNTLTKATLTGTSNQVTVTNGTGSITLSTPQDIGTGSSPTFAGLTASGLTASRALVTDGSKALASSAATATEVGYLSGVTSAIQTQLNAKQATINFADKETPSGSINDSNVTFTLANTPTSGSEHVFLNGVLQDVGAGNDYTISSAVITFLTPPATGDKLRVTYRY